MIPSIEMLDGSPIDVNAMLKVSASTLADVHSQLCAIEDELDDEDRLENEIFATVNRESAPVSSINSCGRPGIAAGNSMSGSLEGLPDTGSELTHGSAVVLAGNVAAAMRRRRNNQCSDHNVNDTKSSNGRRRGSSNSGNATGETKEFESALDVLDSVLIAPPSPVQPDDLKEKMFFKEGDITDTIFPSNSVATPSKGKYKSDLSIDALASPSIKKPAPFSFDDAPTNLISATKRPKSAFTGTTYRLAPASNNKMDSPEKEKKSFHEHQQGNAKVIPVPSPRQKNSSRPQSAVNPSMLGSISLPFNVAVPASESNVVAANSHRRQRRNTDSHDSEDDDEGIIDAMRARKIVGMRTEADGSPLLGKSKKGGSIVHLDIVKRTMKLEDIEDQIVDNNKDGVINLKSNYNCDSDVEEIGITHSERLRMMSSSTTNTTSTINKNRQNVLLKLQSKSGTVGAISVTDEDDEVLLPPSRKLSGSSLEIGKLSSTNTPRLSGVSSGSSNGTASKVILVAFSILPTCSNNHLS